MVRRPGALAFLAAACALTLGACNNTNRPAPSDPHANAPGSPGTGNATVQVQPAAPDSPTGGPSGIAGSVPRTGVTGKGTTEASGNSAAAQPGVGLNGGLNADGASVAASGPAGTGPAGNGSPNRTTPGSVGNR